MPLQKLTRGRCLVRITRHMTCLFGIVLSALGYSGEIVYQDYLDESVLLSAKDCESDAYVNTHFDWNYHFESMRLSVVAKIVYETDGGTNSVFRPVVARYDFNGIREPVSKTIQRADKCFDGFVPAGFCMVGLDSFLFTYGPRQSPRTAFMSLSGPTQTVEEVTHKINGMFLHGALSAAERAVFPDGGGFAFQCIGNTNDWSLLLWDRGRIALRPIASNRRVYACLSDGRVLVDSADDWIKDPEFGPIDLPKTVACCHQVLPQRNANAVPNAYDEWTMAVSNKVMSLGRNAYGGSVWSIGLHGRMDKLENSELGHEFVEGEDVVYDFDGWEVWRMRKTDSDWRMFDLNKYFRDDIDRSDEHVSVPILHRGSDSWYYALFFKCKDSDGDCCSRCRIRIVEVPRKGEKCYLWTFPDYQVRKKLNTFMSRSPIVIRKLPDDSWVFLSCTATFQDNDAILVQRMTGERNEISNCLIWQ